MSDPEVIALTWLFHETPSLIGLEATPLEFQGGRKAQHRACFGTKIITVQQEQIPVLRIRPNIAFFRFHRDLRKTDFLISAARVTSRSLIWSIAHTRAAIGRYLRRHRSAASRLVFFNIIQRC